MIPLEILLVGVSFIIGVLSHKFWGGRNYMACPLCDGEGVVGTYDTIERMEEDVMTYRVCGKCHGEKRIKRKK